MGKTRAKFDKMWRIWYALFVLVLHAFLLYCAFQRYDSFRRKALREQWPMSPMNFYLAMMIAVCFMLPLFAYAAFVQTGNFAEDGVQLGKDARHLKLAVAEATASAAGGVVGGGARACFDRLRRHFVPLTCLLHLLMAYCLLLPLPSLEATEILHRRLPVDEVWRTNLDSLLRPTASARSSVSTEVFNLMLALCLLLIRYSSVFWFANRMFAFLFSLLLCCCGLHCVLSYEAASVLLKAAEANKSVSVGLPPAAIVILQAVGDLLLVVSNLAIFEFGHSRVVAALRKYRHVLQLQDETASERSHRSASLSSQSAEEATCWMQHSPQLLGVLLMLLAVAMKAPLLWEWVALHRQQQQQPILLGAVVTGAAYLAMWVGAWLLFGLRANWRFNARLEMDLPSKLSPGFHDNQGLSGSPEHRPASAKGEHYIFVPRESVSMIPTVSEQVDSASDVYGTVERAAAAAAGGGGGGGANGLVKYQVRRGSVNSSVCGSLRRSDSAARRTRVTFKDLGAGLPTSPTSSSHNASSSDSGIESARLAASQISDDYARVNKPPLQQLQQQRATSRGSNYDDYQMFGSLFREDRDYFTRQELQQQQLQQQLQQQQQQQLQQQQQHGMYGSQCDIYGTAGNFGFNGGYGYGPAEIEEVDEDVEAEYSARVPDILLSRSPYSSLGRQQKQQQQQLHTTAGSYSSLPPPPAQTEAGIDGLCSQV